MKRNLLILSSFISCGLMAQTTIFSENFDTYTAGNYAGVESPVMSTWSLAPGGADDCLISDAQASSGANSINIVGQSGPVDAVVIFPQTYDWYQWRFSMKFFVATGAAGYFNCQETVTPGDGWKCDVFFANNGTGYVSADGNATAATFNYTQNTWFDVAVEADLSNDQGKIFIDGNLVHTFVWSTGVNGQENRTHWGGINFYAYGPNDQAADYYVDDMLFEDITDDASIDQNEELSFSLFPNPSNGISTVQLGTPDKYNVLLSDLSGKTIWFINDYYGQSIELPALVSGAYLVTISNGLSSSTKKLIVQ